MKMPTLDEIAVGNIFNETELIEDVAPDKKTMETICRETTHEGGRISNIRMLYYDVLHNGVTVSQIDNNGYDGIFVNDPCYEKYNGMLRSKGL